MHASRSAAGRCTTNNPSNASVRCWKPVHYNIRKPSHVAGLGDDEALLRLLHFADSKGMLNKLLGMRVGRQAEDGLSCAYIYIYEYTMASETNTQHTQA